MANGVAAINRFITPYPNATPSVETMKIGWRMISRIGRPWGSPAAFGGTGGNRSCAMMAIAINATTAKVR